MACVWFVLVAMEPVKVFGHPGSIIQFSSKHSDSQLIISVPNKFKQFRWCQKLTRFRYFEEHDMRELYV